MEGVGSRQGRVSSKYGASQASTPLVFHGRVRKWRRQWVSSEFTGDNAPGNKGRRHQKRDATRSLLLCRWTPLTSTASDMLPPPNRKFRYTPVIVLDEVNKEVCTGVVDDSKLSTVCPSEANMTVRSDISFQDSKSSDSFQEDMKSNPYVLQETRKEQLPVNQCHLDLQLHFKN